MNRFEFRKRVLAELHENDGLPVSSEQLHMTLKMSCRPMPLASELSEALGFLEGRGFITGVRDRMDETVVNWSITASGRAEHLSR